MPKNIQNTTLFFILSIVVYQLISSYTTSPIGFMGKAQHDHEIYRYIAMAMSKGAVIGRDVFDNKPPFTYYMAYIGHLLDVGPWGIWIVMNMFTLSAAIVLFLSLRKFLQPFHAFLIVALYIVIIGFESISSSGLTRTVTSSLTFLFVGSYLLIRKDIVYIVLSFISFLVFITLPNDLFGLFPLLLFILFNATPDNLKLASTSIIIRRILIFSSGFLSCSILLMLIYYFKGMLYELFYHMFLFNFKYYLNSGYSFIQKFYNTLHHLFLYYPQQMFFSPLLLIAFFPLLLILKSGLKKIWLIYLVLISGFLLQLLSTIISGHGWFFYMQSLVPYFIFLTAFTVIIFLRYNPLKKNQWPFFKPVFIIGLIFYFIVLNFIRVYFIHRGLHDFGAYRNDPYLVNIIKKEKAKHPYTFYSPYYVYHLSINTDLKILCPTKWMFFDYWYRESHSFDLECNIFDRVVEDINAHKTLFLVDNPKARYRMVYDRSDVDTRWNKLLEDKYQWVKNLDNDLVLYRRKKEYL